MRHGKSLSGYFASRVDVSLRQASSCLRQEIYDSAVTNACRKSLHDCDCSSFVDLFLRLALLSYLLTLRKRYKIMKAQVIHTVT